MLTVTLGDLRLYLHVVAASIWVGGQIALAGLVPALRAAGTDVPKAAARAFARIAWPAFGVLVLTGIWNVSADHDELKHSGDFRHTLIAKLVFVVLSGVTAFMHARATTRRGMAVWGAGTGIFALLAMFYGIILSHG